MFGLPVPHHATATHLPPFGHIWDVMLVWRKGNINRTVSVLQYCVPLQLCTMVWAVLTGRSTGLGFDLAWFSYLSSKHVCVIDLHDAIYAFKFSLLYRLVRWAWWDWPLTSIILHCCDTVGWVIWPVKSYPEMTCNVLNVDYYTIPSN